MKKIVTILLAAVVLSSMVFAGGKKEASSDQSLKKVQDKGVFVLGLDDSFPPYGYRDEDQNIVGYDIDLAAEVCRRLGVTLKCQPIDWNSKEMELDTGNIDCIWNGFTINEERLAKMAFTTPYVDNSQIVAVRKDSGFTTLKDLEGKVIGIQAGSSAAEALDEAADFKATLKTVVEFKDNLTALMDLEIKGVDGVILDIGVAQEAIKNGREFVILDDAVASEQYGVGFRKNDVALRDAVQAALEDMVKDGTMKTIDLKWFEGEKSVIGK